ncbi:MAG: 8-oxo-dGTP diphosphatase [Butyrivibrio hungatei]|nr:8-oxo-dGTP diphosphatase [Butyrivibrio hungatei]
MYEILTTLCYIERDDKYLMLHRVSKKNDISKDKWLGVGGRFEANESPEECMQREILEETGYNIPKDKLKFRGLVTFVSGRGDYELMSLFTAPAPGEEPSDCDEGKLEWIKKSDVYGLNLWEGDKIFFKLLKERKDFFSLKLVYDGKDNLIEADLDGKKMDYKEYLKNIK